MKAVFSYHPDAERKLQGMQFIKVGPNSRSHKPDDSCFYIMTSAEDGDDISYMKCLRRLSELAVQEAPGEHVVPIAAVTSKYEGVCVQIGTFDVLVEPGSPEAFGVHVELSRKLLSVHTKARIYGPWVLEHGSDTRLMIVADMAQDEVAISWKAPFGIRTHNKLQKDGGLAHVAPSLRACLDALADRAGVPGAFAASSEEEMQLAAGQILNKVLAASTQLARSKAGASAQICSLDAVAKHQSYELLQEQFRNSQATLQDALHDRNMARSALEKLQDELATLRRSIFPPQDARTEGTGRDPQVAGSGERSHDGRLQSYDAGGDASIEALSQELREHLPQPAATMLRNSLRLMSSELYSGPSRALWELLQNADDCTYQGTPHLTIVEDPRYLWLEYNERGFTFQDVKALCSLGLSLKGPGQTGHKGVGFKASFVLSSRPHILSNPFRFFFDDGADCILPHVTPHVVRQSTSFPREPPSAGTAVYLPLRKPVPDLLQEIVPSTLLFLRQLRSLSLETAGRTCTYERRDGDEGSVEVVETAGTRQQHGYHIARGSNPSIAVAFPLNRSTADASWISTTLPLCALPGLKTPLDAPFDLTANREALLEGSVRNAALRDALAELWLKAVEEAQEGSALAARAWTLQPGPELVQLPFWSPFLHRVRSGLQEISLVPVRAGHGQARRLPVTRCRKAESRLLGELALGPEELQLIDLGIPSSEYLSQLPEGTDLGLRDFGVLDLLHLLSLPSGEGEGSPWQARGNRWRQKVVQELAWQKHDIDTMMLRKVPLFPLTRSDVTGAWAGPDSASQWVACEDGNIFWSLPKGAPNGILRVLDSVQGCRADRDLLNLLGCGLAAQPRDVAYAIVQENLGLSSMEDLRFSWSKLAYLGRHWEEILSSSATEKWLSDQTPKEMEALLRSVLVPSRGGGGRLRCDARELRCPFFLGSRPLRNSWDSSDEHGDVVLEPPQTNGVKARLWWELVFLRLGACPCVAGVRLPKGLFALPGIVGELRALLNFYAHANIDLEELRGQCEIEDRSGRIRVVGREPEKRKYSERLLGPKFIQFAGPEFVVDVEEAAGDSVELKRMAEQLLAVILDPTCFVLLALLHRTVQQESRHLLAVYKFLATAWENGELRRECAELEALRKEGFWILTEDRKICRKLPGEVRQEDVERLSAGEEQREMMLDFFVQCLGVAVSAQPDPVVPDACGNREDLVKHGEATNNMELAKKGPARDDAPKLLQSQGASSQSGTKMPPLPALREGADAEVEESADATSVPFRPLLAELPLLSKLLADIFKECGGDEHLFGSMAPARKMVPVSDIKFTQTSIASKFIHGRFKGRSVEAVAKDLKNGKLTPADLPLAVARFHSSYWTLNNRSLYVLNSVSRQRTPVNASVAEYGLCPVTAKFLQLRYGSLLKQDVKSVCRSQASDSKEEDPEAAEPAYDADPPIWDSGDEALLEKGMVRT
ncbi:NOV [Symbiodinium necroappetens]|uniref:NOV protein n=1 Tax=Symbiodinium necroappetens TaxID=1628268 RepID=A0A812VGA3_9DINO|nr:NOV [Symbiodinium necroappetens]